MAKRKEYEDDDFLDEEIDEAIDEDDEIEQDEFEDGEGSELESDAVHEDADEDDADADKEEADAVEEEVTYPPDDKKAVAALEKLHVRLDVNDKGNVWRAIFDDRNGRDQALLLLGGLPALKEVWLLGTKVTPEAANTFKEERPKVTVYY